MSPSMSITLTPSETARTSNVVAASGILTPFRAANSTVLVVGDRHEVGQPRDLEDLAVVVRQPECLHFDPTGAGLCQEPDDQGDAGAVDVVGAREVEDDRAGSTGRGLRVRLVQRAIGRGSLNGPPGSFSAPLLERALGGPSSSCWRACSRLRQ